MKRFALLALLWLPAVQAEIILPADAAPESFYSHPHPALRSLVFVSPETRQMAILPPAPYFLSPPPLLMRAPTAMPPYPPVLVAPGINSPWRPSNRDNSTYNLQRAHAYSQNLYRENSPVLYFGAPDAYYGWSAFSSPYPPVLVPGFNQPARPSNRDNSTYNLDRAHRFSADGYRKP